MKLTKVRSAFANPSSLTLYEMQLKPLSGNSFTVQPMSLTVSAYGGGTTQEKLTEGNGSFDATTLAIKIVIVADYGTTTNVGAGKRSLDWSMNRLIIT